MVEITQYALYLSLRLVTVGSGRAIGVSGSSGRANRTGRNIL